MANTDDVLVKGCGVCIYKSASSNMPPCSECEWNGGEEDRFERETEDHKCGNCRYCNVPSHQYPCLQCMSDVKDGVMQYSKWEPRISKEDLLKMSEELEAPTEEEKRQVKKRLQSNQDTVNHPSHYEQSCSLECIEAMEIIFGVETVVKFCTLNAFKYIWRWKHKNGQEDLKKAKWYIDRVCSYYSAATEVVMYNIDQDWQACLRMLRYIEDQAAHS